LALGRSKQPKRLSSLWPYALISYPSRSSIYVLRHLSTFVISFCYFFSMRVDVCDYTVPLRHSQRTHTYPYERTVVCLFLFFSVYLFSVCCFTIRCCIVVFLIIFSKVKKKGSLLPPSTITRAQ